MLDNLMGNMEEKQAEMKAKLSTIELTETVEGITIKANAAKEILNIEIAEAYMSADRKEELEDLMLVAFNNIITKIAEEEAKASQAMINDMMPGLGGMFGM